MSELPAGWADAPLDDLGTWGSGGTPKAGERRFYGGGIPFVKIGDLNDGLFTQTVETLTEDGLASSAAKMVPPGSLLVAMYGSIGKLGINAIPVATNQAIAFLDPDRSLVSTELIYWGLKAFQSELVAMGQGGTQQNISQKILRAYRIPLPPLAEQRRIVTKLDALTARTARARADLDRIPALAARYKQAVLAKAFSGELTAGWRIVQSALHPVQPRAQLDIQAKYRLNGAPTDFAPPYQVPDTWRWLRLPELGDMDRGKSRHRPRDDARLFGGPFPFVQTGEVRSADRYLTSYSKTYSVFGLEQSRLWSAGTVCITIAANIAETAILGIDACFPDSVVGLSADPARCLPEYVEYFIRTAKSDLEQFAPATAQKNINLEVLGSIRLPVAPQLEQAEIVRRIDGAFAEIDRLTAEAAAARRLLDRLDQAVLANAFRGELVPQDPADEPASVLLDRIRAERASTPKVKRGRPKAVS